MRTIKNVPKIFKKYNLSRYGTSQEAEYKSTNAFMIHFYNAYRESSSYNMPETHPEYLVSNQGMISHYGNQNYEYEEDFRNFVNKRMFRGYVALDQYSTFNTTRSVAICRYDTDDVKFFTTVNYLNDGSKQDSYNGINIQYSYTYGEKHFTTSSAKLCNDMVVSMATGTAFDFYYKDQKLYGSLTGNRTDNSAYFYKSCCIVDSNNGSGSSHRFSILSPKNTIIGANNYSAAPVHGVGNELFYFYNISNDIFSTETTSFINSTADGFSIQLNNTYYEAIKGRYVSGRMYNVDTGMKKAILYFDAENNEKIYNIFDNQDGTNILIGAHDLAVFGNILDGIFFGYIYYKGRIIGETNNTSFIFGTDFFINTETYILTDAETGETFDLSDIIGGRTIANFGNGCGNYCYCTEIIDQWIYLYVISKNKIFKASFPVGSVIYNFLFPSIYHGKVMIILYRDIIYHITETFTAYDMQTLLRVDTLPGFESCVREVWSRTK
jgi:hypothetical protein